MIAKCTNSKGYDIDISSAEIGQSLCNDMQGI